ncbi:O-succinylbenzoate-CoA ligase [Leifsonia xyli subsp. cynodontis DSM 46306]|uniref:Uncharacterized protein n=1 Tax=Leifsonia xyli subsp. cynodontis DSM 46306 TaxID=1389489 RepID=U3PBF3_LEIXC|nr:hypothetical protein [Leifsonia xyli]AGW42072.1 O-succinylbenzoate-CoA ligase [Leifsonia xyli subsp. cynodontis DSM 46306]
MDDSCAEVESSLITVEDEALACWDTTSERAIARYDLREVLSVQFTSPGEGEGRCRRGRTDQAHPNAYRRWTEEDENRIVDFYHRGVSFPEIAAAVGRRVGGVRSRLVHLGVIEPEPGDRISFPGIAFVRERARLLRQPGRPGAGSGYRRGHAGSREPADRSADACRCGPGGVRRR